MADDLLIVAASSSDTGTEADLVRAALGDEAFPEWLHEAKLREQLQDTQRPAPALVLLMPSVAAALQLARSVHARWPASHLLIVRERGALEAFRDGIGIAPMLGRHWSLAEADRDMLAGALRQAMNSGRQRRSLRTTLDRANVRLAQTRPVSTGEYERLLAAQHHLAHFLRASTEAVIGLDGAGQVLLWSEGASQLLQLQAGDVVGNPVERIGEVGRSLRAAVAGLTSEVRSHSVDIEANLQGRHRVLEAILSAPARQSDASGASVILRDVTRQRSESKRLADDNLQLQRLVSERTEALEQSQLALLQAQKLEAIGQLTGGVAHDFNNVLQVIGSNLQLLQARLLGDAGADQLLRAALGGVDRGAKLASQLLSFARRQPLRPLPMNIGRRLRDMDDLLRRSLGEMVQIETSIAGGLWTTLIDANQLENVVLNLAINARDAMPQGGKLTIEAGNAVLDESYTDRVPDLMPGQYVMLAISDTGEGMPAHVVARAFEPFFTTKPEGKGTGLGLSMAYGFAKQSGGHIRIYSEPGSGTTIKLYLPRSMEKEVETPRAATGAIVGGSETVLVVEDDMGVQAAVVNTLQNLGYRVLRASDAQAALTVLESGVQVDLLFTDVVMPGPLRSPDLAVRAKALLPDIAVLFTSGYTQNAIVHGGRLDAGVELLSKPYRQEDLARKIRQVLTRRAAVQAPPAPASSALENVQNGHRPRILLVEDQEDLRETTLQLLGILECEALGAATADAAEALLAGGARFDVMITDITLPGRSGIELAQQVHRDFGGMKIVFCSGHGAPDGVAADLGCWNLPKPYSLGDLESLLKELGLR
ncbi:MAG: response regulator [Ramlibacter sp.]